MGQYRNVSVSFWTDTKVYDEFDWSDRYLYIYFLTNSHTNICGCYEVSRKQMMQETGLSPEVLTDALFRLEHEHNVIRYSARTKELLILNWHRYNWSNSEKLISAVESVAQHIKDADFRDYVANLIKKDVKKERTKERTETEIVTDTETETVSDTESDVSIGYGYPMDRVSETEPEGSRVCVDLADFETFWAAYPRAIRREEAKAAFDAAAVPLETLLAAIEAQKETDAWKRGVIPAPARWLKEHRWTDSVPSAQNKAGKDKSFQPGDAELKAIREMKAAKARRKGEQS